jgi:GR25 family glycosyltransferase involved in LPS biosynthesis
MTYVIVMDDPARKAHIERVKKEHPCLNVTVWPAVTTKDLHKPHFKSYFSLTTEKRVRHGAIACALSHLLLLKFFLSTQEREMLVLEDDAVLHPEFEEMLQAFRFQLPADNDFSQLLHHASMRSLRSKAVYKTWAPNVMKSYAPYGTVAYLISRRGARKVLARAKPIWYPIDEMIRSSILDKYLISYMPIEDLVTMPYSMQSNVWNTSTGPIRSSSSAVPATLPELSICEFFPFRWNDSLRQPMVELMSATHQLLEEIGVEYALVYSTLLGFYRHGQHFIPWDDDADMYIRPQDTERVIARIQQDTVYCTESFWGGPKIFRCDGLHIYPYNWSYPFIDIFNINTSEVAPEIMWPTSLATFEGIQVRIPKNPQAHLSTKYGNPWQKECTSADYNHAKEQMVDVGVKREACEELQAKCGSMWPDEMAPRAKYY